MRFGMMFLLEQAGEGEGPALRRQVELMRAAEDLDFDSVWVAEHHFSDLGYGASPALSLAAVARATKRIRLGTAVVVLPFNHPLRVAEDYAFLDQLSEGRVDLGVGRGVSPLEFAGLGIDPATAGERFEESLEVIRQAWRNGRVNFSGRHHRFADVPVRPRPLQDPHPPIWMAAVSPESFALAGRLGCNLLSGTVLGLDRSVAAQRRADYERGLREGGHGLGERASGCLLAVYVADTLEAARRDFHAPIAWLEQRVLRRPLACAEDAVVCGSPDVVAERLLQLQQIYGFTEVLCWTRLVGLEHRKVLRSMELMRDEVMPLLRDRIPPGAPAAANGGEERRDG